MWERNAAHECSGNVLMIWILKKAISPGFFRMTKWWIHTLYLTQYFANFRSLNWNKLAVLFIPLTNYISPNTTLKKPLSKQCTHFFCPICFVPFPGVGLWFGFLHFTENHSRIPHIADHWLISHLTNLWTWWKMGRRARYNGEKMAPYSLHPAPFEHVSVNIDIHLSSKDLMSWWQDKCWLRMWNVMRVFTNITHERMWYLPFKIKSFFASFPNTHE